MGGGGLDYTVRGATAADASLRLDVTATDGMQTYYAESLFGATTRAKGAHRVYWNMAADGVAPITTNGMAASCRRGRYCVIDLSAGADAKAYPVSYLPSVPTGGWTDEYKTRKIVLRRIDAPSGGVYYAGVFEVSEAQWANVMGGVSAVGTRPKTAASYNAIHGDAGTYDWPSSGAVDPTSFVGRLRQKTGLSALDLPSEAEWECAVQMRGDSTTCTGTCGSGAWIVCRAAATATGTGCCAGLRVLVPQRPPRGRRLERLRVPAVLPPRIEMSFLRRKRAGSRARRRGPKARAFGTGQGRGPSRRFRRASSCSRGLGAFRGACARTHRTREGGAAETTPGVAGGCVPW